MIARCAWASAAFVLALGAVPRLGPVAWAGDPTTLDCLTANESSLTLRNRLELRATRAQLLICSAASCPADIRNECIRSVGEVNQAMPTIVFEAKDAGGRNLLAVAVKMDGEPLAQRLEGTALSIDPGQHKFTFEVPGQAPVEKSLLILEGEKDRRERIVFEDLGKAPPSTAATADGHAPAASVETARPRLGTARTVGLALGGIGVVALALGTAYGLVAISRRNAATEVCPSQCADTSGVERWNQARAAGDVATVGFIVGGAAVAGGAALWLIARSESDRAPKAHVALGPGFLQVVGRW